MKTKDMINQKKTVVSLLNPVCPFRDIYRYRDLLWQIVKRNILSRYKGSIFGLFWMVATPLLMLAIYTFVFGIVFKSRWGLDTDDSKISFALILFCGLAAFNIFSESVNGSVDVITGNLNYVKKVLFPLEILPVASMVTASFFGLLWILILFVAVGVFMRHISLTAICFPLILFPLMLFSCGLAWFVASLRVYCRDMTHFVDVFLRILLYASAVFYPLERLPEVAQRILILNPLVLLIQFLRNALFLNQFPDWRIMILMYLVSFGVFHAGYIWFMKTKRGFADVI